MAEATNPLGSGLEILIDGQIGILRGRFLARELELVRDMPGRKKWKDSDLIFESTDANLKFIADEFPGARRPSLEIEPAHLEAPDVKFRFGTKPMQHQLEAFQESKDAEEWAYFLEMGLGKTKIFIDVCAYLWSIGAITGVVLVAPNGIHEQFIVDEVKAHMPNWVPHVAWAWKCGKQPKNLMDHSMELKILAVNVEAVNFARGYGIVDQFLNSQQSVMMGVDESTIIKNHKAKRSKKVKELGRRAKYRRILTGSPVTKGLEDLYSQCEFLNPELLGFGSFFSYRAYFCKTIPIPGASPGAQRIIGYQNEDVLVKKMKRFSTRRTKSECLDLPEKVYMPNRPVELTPEQAKMYKQMREEYYAEIGDTVIDAPLAITRLVRMQQMLGGYVPDADGNMLEIPTNRYDALRQTLEEIDGQAIIWSRFQPEIQRIASELGNSAVTYYGPNSKKERTEALDYFQRNEAKYIICSSAAARGLNQLKHCEYAIYFSHWHDAEIRWQSEDRIHRNGMKGGAFYTDIVAKGTVDVQIAEALRRKEDVAKVIERIRP